MLATRARTRSGPGAGSRSTARGTEAMALMVPSLLAAIGFAPFALTVAR